MSVPGEFGALYKIYNSRGFYLITFVDMILKYGNRNRGAGNLSNRQIALSTLEKRVYEYFSDLTNLQIAIFSYIMYNIYRIRNIILQGDKT